MQLSEGEVLALEAAGKIHRGRARINPKNFEQVFVPGGKRTFCLSTVMSFDVDTPLPRGCMGPAGFPIDVLVSGFKERNRALDGDEVAVLLHDEAQWNVLEKADTARPLRFRSWASALSPKCASPEFAVVCKALAAEQVAPMYERLTAAGIGPELVDVVPETGAVHICCRDEIQARMVMALDGLQVGGKTLALSRGDGELLPLDQLPERFVQPVGKIVAVEPKDPNRTFCGTLRPFNKQAGLFVSKDHRVPRVIVPHAACPPGFADDARRFSNTLVSVKITQWPLEGTYANGEVVAVVGETGNVHAEVKAILLENDVDDSDFPPSVLESLPKLDGNGEWHIPKDELARRRDLRDTCIFTIDPATARDLDDALSFRALEGGECEVGCSTQKGVPVSLSKSSVPFAGGCAHCRCDIFSETGNGTLSNGKPTRNVDVSRQQVLPDAPQTTLRELVFTSRKRGSARFQCNLAL